MTKKKKPQKAKEWMPLQRVPYEAPVYADDSTTGRFTEAWVNDTYQVFVAYRPDGFTHLSIKRNDRRAIRDWRHLQAIKNELCGIESWAIEIFPPEGRLLDAANQFHLFVYPEGQQPPVALGFGRAIGSHGAMNEARVQGDSKARQRPWQPGLPTGATLADVVTNPELARALRDADRAADEQVREHLKGGKSDG